SYGGWHGTSPHYQRHIMQFDQGLGAVLNTVRPTPVEVCLFSDSPTARPQTYKAPEPRLFYYLEKPLNWGFTCRDGEI
ncbi:MAG: hypothetical protein QF596_04245, partial [Acidimicrobiales bacterium]|nr:hypothetical protein [Acidimicrobiales bacterium]